MARLHVPTIDLPAAHELPPPLLPATQRLHGEAESVLRHRVDVLGSGETSLGPNIDWQLDFKSGYRWPALFYQDVEVTRLWDASDAKVPWELSRGHHLLTLARAARLFEDERFAEELERELDSWLTENPPGIGINWVNPMEVALRVANWIWAIGTLQAWRPLDPDLTERVTASLQSHGRHIAANLEGTPYLRSNHYLADIFGLLVLGTVVDGDPAAPRWFHFARRALEREIGTQVHADGIGFEGSLSYHGLAFEIFLLSKLVADRHGVPFTNAYEARLAVMYSASQAVRHPDGRLPQFGDADSGRVLPAGFDRPPTLDHLLWVGSAILERERPLPGAPHEEVAWTLGLAAWKRLSTRPAAGLQSPAAEFPDGGLYVLAGGNAHLVVRCGDVGQHGSGGHAHNDLLSFELSYGVPLIIDSGTYAYTADPPARNAFRATAAHNSVVVAGAEINPIVEHELFSLRQVARPVVERWERRADRVTLVASHDGYRVLQPPVIHRRTFDLDPETGVIDVTDDLLGCGRQSARSLLHFAAGSYVEARDATTFVVSGREGSLVVSSWGVDAVSVGDSFVSDRFGVRERAPLLVAEVEGKLPLRFGFRFNPVLSTAAPRPGMAETPGELSR